MATVCALLKAVRLPGAQETQAVIFLASEGPDVLERGPPLWCIRKERTARAQRTASPGYLWTDFRYYARSP